MPTVLDELSDLVVSIDYDIDNAIYGFLDAVTNLFAMFPAGPVTEFLQGALLLVRRTFFDQAPTLNPMQETVEPSGDITGTLGGFDPEGETIIYSLIIEPEDGTVTINSDGTYVYTPGLAWDGSDAFIVSATDQIADTDLLQGNWIDPTRPTETDAFVEVDQVMPAVQGVEIDETVTQGKITFIFLPADKAARVAWRKRPLALPLLELAAFDLAAAFDPANTVTLRYTYDKLTGSTSLASMTSYSSNKSGDTFVKTTAQAKLTGNYNYTGTDGELEINFNKKWNYGNKPLAADQYMFKKTAMHELLHSFGFRSNVSAPGCNETVCDAGVTTRTPKTRWTLFDSYIGISATKIAINRGTRRWKANPFDDYIEAMKWENGLFFVGPNAIAAFGKPVPLYSPDTFSKGTSISHLSPDYFTNPDLKAENALQLMNTKTKAGVVYPTTLSKVEISILKDLGFRMMPAAATTVSPV